MRPLAIAAALLCSPAFAQSMVTPDPVALMRRSVAAEKANSAKAQQYTYRYYKVNIDFDKNGKESERRSETWDIIGLEGSTYRKLVMRNDKPLPPKEKKREDDRQQKEAERRRKETPEERRNRTLSFSYSFYFPYARAADIYDLRYAGEEAVEGRPAYVVEGSPKPGFHPANDSEKESLNYRFKIWLDREDLVSSRIELEVIGDHSRMQKGSIVYGLDWRNEDGVWLSKVVTFKYTAKFFKMLTARGEMTGTYTDYKKFQVDSRILDVVEK